MKKRVTAEKNNQNTNNLSKALGRTDVLALGFGTMVGWSWVIFATAWVTQAGFWGAIIAFLLGSIIILIIGLCYGELTAALPLAGGEFVYVYRALGSRAAWLVGWVMTFAYIGVAAWEGIAIATALDYLLPIPSLIHLWDIADYSVYLSWASIGMIGAAVMLILNLFDTRPAILFQVMATAGLLIIGFIILFGGITFGNVDNTGKPFTDFSGFNYVLLMVPSMLIGFDVIPQSAEEMNLNGKEMGRMVLACIIMAIIWYVIILVGVSLAAPVEVRMSGLIPSAEVLAYAYKDPLFGDILIIGGILGILTCWNGFFMGATRLLFAMGRAQMLPAVFGRLHKKYRTPWAATLLVGITCICAPLLGQNALLWFVNTSSFCALFSYFCVALAFLILRIKEPSLYRPFKLKHGESIGIAAVCLSAIYFVLYLTNTLGKLNESVEIVLIGIWMIIGIFMMILTRTEYKKIDHETRETLIFGEKFARKQ